MAKAQLKSYRFMGRPAWIVIIPGMIDHVFRDFAEALSWGANREWMGLNG